MGSNGVGTDKKDVNRPAHIVPDVSTLTACAVVFVVAGLCFAGSLDGEFVFDDAEAVTNNEDVRPETPLAQLFQNDFWGTNIKNNKSHKSYRPLTILSFRWNYALSGGLKARDFHATNVVLHAAVSSLSVLVFARMVGEQRRHRLSFLSAVLYAVHPVKTEAVAGIVGRADLLCCLFYFLSLLTYTERRRGRVGGVLAWTGSMVCCVVAMLCKEQGVTVLGVGALYDVVVTAGFRLGGGGSGGAGLWRSGRWRTLAVRLAAAAAVGLSLLYGRWIVMGSAPPAFQKVDNPASFAASALTRTLTYNYVYALHALLLVMPHWLCFDWSMGCVPLVTGWSDARNAASLLLWLFLAASAYQALASPSVRQRRYLTLALGLMVVPFLPATNVLFRVGFVVAERILMLPAAGCCLLVVYGLQRLHERRPSAGPWLRAGLAALLLVYAAKAHRRSLEWTTESRLFRSALRVCPLNAKVHYNIAKNAADQGQRDLAVSEYQVALQLNPDYDQAMNNLANLLKDVGRLADAERLLADAVHVRPDFAAAWMNKGIVEAMLKKYGPAQQSYLTALTHRRKYPDCYYNLGNLYLELERWDEAYEAFRNATNLQPRHVLAWTNMIVMLDNTGRTERSMAVAVEALALLPDEANLHFSLAGILGKRARFVESERHFAAALELQPLNPTYHTNLGVLYHRWKRYDDAERSYRRALSLQSDLKSAQDNLRLLLKSKGP